MAGSISEARRAATVFGLLLAMNDSAALSLPQCPPPPEPQQWNGFGPIYIDRDVETCRTFSEQITYDSQTGAYGFFWHEDTASELQALLDHGFRIMFSDRYLSGLPMTAREYFNTGLAHYFLAIPDEWGPIERGEAGPGWVATGYEFVVRKPTFSPISVSVQRFYGSVSPGPNSHFFTIDQAEARGLQNLFYATPPDQPRWHSEGIPFNAFPLRADANCEADKQPVWRSFNGGAARGREPNHRFSTDRPALEAMGTDGWVAEGIAFCVDKGP